MNFNEISEEREKLKNYLISSKYDLDNLVDILFSHSFKVLLEVESLKNDDPYHDIMALIEQMLPSYLAPAYHYNYYIDALITDIFWDDIKYNIPENEHLSNKLRVASYQINMQALFLSIKMALDRLVLLFSYYYKGFSTSTTFGRYNEKGKPTGFMSKVNELKDKDSIMEYIEEQYQEWIKIAVSPRDTISHYNDLAQGYIFDSKTMSEIPIHINERLFLNIDNNYSFNVFNLKTIVEYWYAFFDKIISELLKKDLVINITKY